ncbi:hypothetical protein TWF703_004626, partial [Orbilia oligospora]
QQQQSGGTLHSPLDSPTTPPDPPAPRRRPRGRMSCGVKAGLPGKIVGDGRLPLISNSTTTSVQSTTTRPTILTDDHLHLASTEEMLGLVTAQDGQLAS